MDLTFLSALVIREMIQRKEISPIELADAHLAMAAVYEWVREANRFADGPVGDEDLREMLGVLGLETLLAAGEAPPEEVRELAALRAIARERRDWAEADRLRDELRAMGWEVRDGPEGPELVRAA